MSFLPHNSQTYDFNNNTRIRPQIYETGSESQNQNRPRLSYFISRSNGTAVPLIPADELPFNVRLHGVARVMSFAQTIGMQHIGTAPYTGLTFKLESDATIMESSTSQLPGNTHARSQSSTGLPRRFLAPDAFARQALANDISTNNAIAARPQSQQPHPVHDAATYLRKSPTSDPADKTQAIIDAIVGSEAGAETAARIGYLPKSAIPPPPSGNLPNQDLKEFCTYWIRTGECDYAQQGCLFKHEMPDKATLEKIGFRTVPRWWQEKNKAIKMGGEKANVGPIVKPSMWLSRRFGNDSNADGECEGSDSETDDEGVKRKAKDVAVKVEKKKLVDEEAKKAEAKVTSHGQTPTPDKPRQKSTSSDLINFTSSLGTQSSLTPTSTSGSPANTLPRASSAGLDSGSTSQQNARTAKIMKVFVPAGESPEKHVADVKNRMARNQSQRGRMTNSADALPLDKQIQNLQKGTYTRSRRPASYVPASAAVPASNGAGKI